MNKMNKTLQIPTIMTTKRNVQFRFFSFYFEISIIYVTILLVKGAIYEISIVRTSFKFVK